MNNKTGFNRLGLTTDHRCSLKRNMAMSLFKYERITTVKSRAKEVSRFAEKLITKAKRDTVFSRRLVLKEINDKKILVKLFSDLGKHYESRNGGYTRILKLGLRKGDASQMVVLELVDRERTDTTLASKKVGKSLGKLDDQGSSKEIIGNRDVPRRQKSKKGSSQGSTTKSPDAGSVKKPQRGGGLRGK